MNETQFRQLFPNASRSLLEANGFSSGQRDEQERAPALDRKVQGTEGGLARVVVRFTCFRRRLLDPDNNARSVKNLLDGLRHAHLIAQDDPAHIQLITEQVSVSHQREERTEIEIIYP